MIDQEPYSCGCAVRFAGQIARLIAGASTKMVLTKEKTVYAVTIDPPGLGNSDTSIFCRGRNAEAVLGLVEHKLVVASGLSRT